MPQNEKVGNLNTFFLQVIKILLIKATSCKKNEETKKYIQKHKRKQTMYK